MDSELQAFSRIREGYLTIPKFQRGYEWDVPEWRKLWKTIFKAYMDQVTAPNPSTHARPIFLGAVVRQSIESSQYRAQLETVKQGGRMPIWAVIDGQQRLVSLMVTLAVVRDFYFSPEAATTATGNSFHKWSSRFFFFEAQSASAHEAVNTMRVQDKDLDSFVRICAHKSMEDAEAVLAETDRLSQLYQFVLRRLKDSVEGQINFFNDSAVDDDEPSVSPQPLSLDESDAEAGELDEDVTADQVSAVAERDIHASDIVLKRDRDWESEGLLDPSVLEEIIANVLFAAVDIEEVDQSLAYEIFETLNTAGKSLSITDMFRNGYFLLNPNDGIATYDKYWRPLELAHANYRADLSSLENFFFNEAIRQFGWTDRKSTYRRLMDSLRAPLDAVALSGGRVSKKRHSEVSAKINQSLQDIADASCAYLAVKRGSEAALYHPALLSAHFDFLRRLDIAPLMPILMQLWLLVGTADEKEASESLGSAMVALEGLVVRRTICGVSAQQLRSLTSEWARKMSEAAHNATARERLRAGASKLQNLIAEVDDVRYPTDKRVLDSIDVPLYALVSKKSVIFYILWELHRELDHDERARLRPAAVGGKGPDRWTTEHVLPQWNSKANSAESMPTMAPDWKADWASSGVANPEEEFVRLVHTIGNLIPLRNGLNSKLSALPFARKKTILKERGGSSLAISRAVVNSETWLPQDIESRTETVLNMVINRWPDVRK